MKKLTLALLACMGLSSCVVVPVATNRVKAYIAARVGVAA